MKIDKIKNLRKDFFLNGWILLNINDLFIEKNHREELLKINLKDCKKDPKNLGSYSLTQESIKKNSPRSIDAINALARFRGSQNGCRYAEAFKVVRIVV